MKLKFNSMFKIKLMETMQQISDFIKGFFLKLLALIKSIPVDKKLHFLAGYCLMSTMLVLTSSQILSIVVLLVVALGKEVYDQISYRGFDIKDFYYTIIGGVLFDLIWFF